MNGRYLIDALDQLQKSVDWDVYEELLEERPIKIEDLELINQLDELDNQINNLMQDASAKISAEDNEC